MPADLTEIIARLEYDPNTGFIHWKAGERRAGKRAFTYAGKRGYCYSTWRSKNGAPNTTLSAHRVAWALYYGDWPSGQIDHINGIKTDNRISNLRDVTNAENAKNAAMGRNNTSGVVGVYKESRSGKWIAQIYDLGKRIFIGSFSDFGDAVIARKAAEKVWGYHENHGREQLRDGAASRRTN